MRGIGPVALVRQIYRNNGETTGLSMSLAAAGTPVDQRVLQRKVEGSGPLDPVGADGEWVWGPRGRASLAGYEAEAWLAGSACTNGDPA